MCLSMPPPPKLPDRQAVKLPEDGATGLADDDARRRRALATTAFTGALGLGNSANTTTSLGG